MTNCSVCLDTLSSKRISALSCGHVFHHECISLWIERQPHCPLCKKSTNHHGTSVIPLYLELTGQPTAQDPLSIIYAQHQPKDQYNQLQNQLQSARRKLKMERQQFEIEKSQYMNELRCYQNMRHIKEVLELEASLSQHQIYLKIENWKAMPHDQLAERMGLLVERHGILAKELDDTELELNFSKRRIQQLKERLALSRSGLTNGNNLTTSTTHLDPRNTLKRKRSLSSNDDAQITMRLDKKPVIDLDADDNTNGDDGAYRTMRMSSFSHKARPDIQHNGSSSSSSSSGGSGNGSSSSSGGSRTHMDYHTSYRLAPSQMKYEAPTSVNTRNTSHQQVVSIIDSDDECTPAIPVSSKSRTRNSYTPSGSNASNTNHSRSSQLIVLLSDDEE